MLAQFTQNQSSLHVCQKMVFTNFYICIMGKNKVLKSIDLFCGAGGLSEGFKQAGFTVLAANDFDSYSASTFKIANPNVKFIDGPIQSIKADDFLSITGLKVGELDCLAGGPPCQAFSVYNHQRGMHDERSGLFREYLRIVKGLLPKWVVMENVTGMQSVDNGKAIKEIHEGLEKLGYNNVSSRILKAENYGVPQERRRLIFIANRVGVDIAWPDISHDGVKNQFVTIENAIGDLPYLENGDGDEISSYKQPVVESSKYQRLLRGNSQYVYNHVAPKLSEINMKRVEIIPIGGSWRDLPINLLPAGMQKAKRSDHTKRYGRLNPNGLSSTILTKCDIHWGCFIHPYQNRAITVREAARLQSFPDRFVFHGPRTEQYRQVGNAVPPLLAKAIAEKIREMILKSECCNV